MTKTIRAALFAATLSATLAACGDSTGTSGSGNATLRVAARGDDAPSRSAAPTGEAPRFAESTASGTVDFRARVYARTESGGWLELTNQAAQAASVDASGQGDAQVFAASKVEAGTYARVRVVFEQVRARMNGSLLVSTGLLSGTVDVDMAGDGNVTVERQVNASVQAGGTSRLLINLNASAWLNQASATTRTVNEAAFASAVAVTAD
jgi:hypothetical protein